MDSMPRTNVSLYFLNHLQIYKKKGVILALFFTVDLFTPKTIFQKIGKK